MLDAWTAGCMEGWMGDQWRRESLCRVARDRAVTCPLSGAFCVLKKSIITQKYPIVNAHGWMHGVLDGRSMERQLCAEIKPLYIR